MSSSTNQTTSQALTGDDAIAYAKAHGLRLSKYADPIEDARDDLTIDDAMEIAAIDPALIWVETIPEPASPKPSRGLQYSVVNVSPLSKLHVVCRHRTIDAARRAARRMNEGVGSPPYLVAQIVGCVLPLHAGEDEIRDAMAASDISL